MLCQANPKGYICQSETDKETERLTNLLFPFALRIQCRCSLKTLAWTFSTVLSSAEGRISHSSEHCLYSLTRETMQYAHIFRSPSHPLLERVEWWWRDCREGLRHFECGQDCGRIAPGGSVNEFERQPERKERVRDWRENPSAQLHDPGSSIRKNRSRKPTPGKKNQDRGPTSRLRFPVSPWQVTLMENRAKRCTSCITWFPCK